MIPESLEIGGGGELIDIPQDELDMSVPVEECHTPESNEDTEGERQRREQEFPGVHDRYTGHPISTLLPQSTVQQVPVASVVPSSPRSVLQPKFSIQISLSNYGEEMNVDIQDLDSQLSENNALDEPRGECLTSIAPHSTILFIEDPTSHISDSRDAKILQVSHQEPELHIQAKFCCSIWFVSYIFLYFKALLTELP